MLGIGVGLLGFILETISLHQLDRYFIFYWSTRYTGLALALTGVAWSFMSPLDTASPANPSLHARYWVGSIGSREVGDPPIRRVARLGLVLLVLATPELVDLMYRLIAAE